MRIWLLATLLFVASTPSMTLDKHTLLSDLKRLSSDEMAGRKPGTEGHKRAQSFIIERYQKLGLKAFDQDYRQHFSYRKNFKDNPGVNLIAYLPGHIFSDQYIVITAHYDHLGTRGERIYNGADDNASGVAAMLSLAQRMVKNRPNHSVIFFATDAEEDGLKGAEHFVKNPPVPLESIKLNVNLDMIANGGKKRQLYLAGRKSLPQAIPYFKSFREQVNQTDIKLTFGHDRYRHAHLHRGEDRVNWLNASDHGPFNKKGIPYLYFGVDTHAHYHKTSDTYENVDLTFYVSAVKTIAQALNEVDQIGFVAVNGKH